MPLHIEHLKLPCQPVPLQKLHFVPAVGSPWLLSSCSFVVLKQIADTATVKQVTEIPVSIFFILFFLLIVVNNIAQRGRV